MGRPRAEGVCAGGTYVGDVFLKKTILPFIMKTYGKIPSHVYILSDPESEQIVPDKVFS